MDDAALESILEINTDTKKAPAPSAPVKGSYAGTSSTSFRDFLLKPELMNAIGDCGFEHPSQVQQECIPQALLGTDIISQGKSGMGKTAVFVISVLQQMDPVEGEISSLVIAPTRELAYQISAEFTRFSKHMPKVKVVVLYGGIPKSNHIDLLKKEKPNIIVSTPGRLLDLLKDKAIDLSKVRFFVIDECDKVLEKEDMKKDVDSIYKKLPNDKQVMLFSATMPEEKKALCRHYTKNAAEVFIDDQAKLSLDGLQQHTVEIDEDKKNRKLVEILENFKFNQLVIFVSKVSRAKALTSLLEDCEYPTISIHGDMKQEERIKAFRDFKDFKARILVSTDLTARGIDIERVNIVINYDMPESSDTYLHRVGRAGRFGTKGLAISFISSDSDRQVLQDISSRFPKKLTALPESINSEIYTNA